MIDIKNMTTAELDELIAAARAEIESRNMAIETPKPKTMASMWECPRYNGGWAKKVSGLDKSQINGYSILGTFFEHDSPRTWKEGELILDCDVAGSRSHHRKEYTLLQYREGSLHEVATAEDTKSWAVSLWDAIEAALRG